MLTHAEFIRQSLETHLFFGRIMKEHAFFLETGFTPRDAKFTEHADELRQRFDILLRDCIALSDGVISNEVLNSGEIVTKFTLEAEKASRFLSDVPINTDLTEDELCLRPGTAFSRQLFRKVSMLNRRAIPLIEDIINFKSRVLRDMLECKMFTFNYPLLIEHILREARLYLQLIRKLQSGRKINVDEEAFSQESFWNRIMAEHSKFIRGLLDPTEEELIRTAHDFGKEFDELTFRAKEAMDRTCHDTDGLTRETLNATKDLRDFKAQATDGLLDCKIRSIIIPLLGDHVLREANHYIRLLKIFKQ